MSKRKIFYVAGIYYERESLYAAYLPDFPEISACGQTVQEAFGNANKALYAAIGERVKQKGIIPSASTSEEVKIKIDNFREINGLEPRDAAMFVYLAAPISLLYGLGPIHDSTSKRACAVALKTIKL